MASPKKRSPPSPPQPKQQKLTDEPTSSIAYDWRRNNGISIRDYAYPLGHTSHYGPYADEAAEAEAKNERRKALLQGLSKGDAEIVSSRIFKT
jgi:hypothetical protein